MDRLKRLILNSEDEIVRRLIDVARARGYAQAMPVLEESYRSAVASMSAVFAQSLAAFGGPADLSAADDLTGDTVAELGRRVVRQRRAEAAEASLVMGLLKCVRLAYLETVRAAALPPDEQWSSAQIVDRFFDRVEVGAAEEWSRSDAPSIHRSVIDRNAALIHEKNRYLSAFAGLPVAVLLFDADDRLENVNAAAAGLFGAGVDARSGYVADPARRERSPVLAEELAAFRAGSERETSLERKIKTRKGTRYFQVRVTKLYDIDDAYAGMLVILNDLTYRRHAEEALRRSQAKYLSLFENMLTGFAYTQVVLDRRNRPIDYTFLEVNEAFERLTGLDGADIVGRRFSEVLPGVERGSTDWIGLLGRVALTGETAAFDAYLEPLGRWYSASVYCPTPGYVTLMLTDISELKWIQESLARSRDFYLTLFEGFPALIWRAGPDGRVDYANASLLDFTGCDLDAVVGERWLDVVHEEDRDRRRIALEAAIADRQPFQIEYRMRHRSGDHRWVLETGRPFNDLDGSFAGLIGSATDISERKRAEAAMEHLATHDVLTGLPNRRLFEEALKRSVAHARRGHPSSLLFIDLDGFKPINDTHGHAAGDTTLQSVAAMLLKQLRTEDLIARVGGDEFAVLLQDTVLADARRVAERLRAGAHDGVVTPAGCDVSLSIGLVEIDGHTDAVTVLGHADTAMYRAKESGGDRLSLFAPGTVEVATDEQTGVMLAKLKDALARDGAFVFHFQPVFAVADGHIAYSEALIRLIDREGSVIGPREFVSVAERFGLMPQLSRWVIRQASHVLRDNPDVVLSVNLSGVDLADDSLLAAARSMLADAGVGTDRLGFELSETAILRDLPAARGWIERAREHGFRFALDDFGGGYNSFAYLRGLPVDRVKIDGSVIRSLVADPRQLTLLEAVQSVARSAGMETVAECVENEYVLQVVRDVGVDLAQGYHLGRPSPDILTASETSWEARFPGGGKAASEGA